MTTAARFLIARLRRAGATLTCGNDGKVRFSAPVLIPAALLAEARNQRDGIAAALTAEAPKPPGSEGVANAWGLTPTERAAAIARLRPDRSDAIATAPIPDAYPEAPASDLGELPDGPCSRCGAGLWCRLSVIETDGPGAWACQTCHPLAPDVWLDACVIPVRRPGATDEPTSPAIRRVPTDGELNA